MTCGIIEQFGSVLSGKKNAIFPIILSSIAEEISTGGFYTVRSGISRVRAGSVE